MQRFAKEAKEFNQGTIKLQINADNHQDMDWQEQIDFNSLFVINIYQARYSATGCSMRSSGFFTPRPPLFSTCVYIIVVDTSEWPSSFCTVRMS